MPCSLREIHYYSFFYNIYVCAISSRSKLKTNLKRAAALPKVPIHDLQYHEIDSTDYRHPYRHPYRGAKPNFQFRRIY